MSHRSAEDKSIHFTAIQIDLKLPLLTYAHMVWRVQEPRSSPPKKPAV